MFRPPMRKAFASGRIFATTHGSAPWRVVALPGWMHTAADYDGVLGPLAATGSLAVDLPGFGGLNPDPPAVWGAAGYAEWLEQLVDELEGPVVAVGHSRGGAVALHLAVRRPEAVRGLVLAGVPLLRREGQPPAQPPFAFRAAKWLHQRGVLPDSRMEAMRKKFGSADYRNASGVMRDILVKVTNEFYDDELRAVTCPVEFVWGANDTAAPVDVAERAAALVGRERARVTVVSGGHQVPVEHPDAVRAAIERLLAGSTTQGSA
jgi:pimeloyl-ACP methyl ester carboxylesterase